MAIRNLVPFLAVLILASPLARAEAPQHLTVQLVSEDAKLAPGRTSYVGLHFKLDPHWHVYWVNPGDSGLAPKIEWKLPQGYDAGGIEWPAPQRITLGPLVNYGYDGEVLLMMPMKVPSTAKAGETATLAGTAKWLVCNDICIPGSAPVELKLPIAGEPVADPQWHALFEVARTRLPKPAPANFTPRFTTDKEWVELRVEHAPAGDAVFYPLEPMQVLNGVPQSASRSGDTVTLKLKRNGDLKEWPKRLRGVLSFSPTDSYRIEAPVASSTSLALMLVFAFLGGIILNLMPCVFPVLSIKVLSFLHQSQEEKSIMRKHGLVYSLGILVSFWSLVAVLLLLRSGGEQLGWGFQLQSPGFTAFLCWLLFLFGLSLVGVFEIGGSFAGVGSDLASRGGYSGSFFTGVLATVVATPCSAPFMGSAVGFALSQSAPIAFLIFTSLALGLALPYLWLSFQPGLARFLPRPGRWMETLKQFMAFPVFGTVIWLMWVFGLQTGVSSLSRLLAGLLLVSMGAWMLGRWRDRLAYRALAGALMLAALVLTVTGPKSGGVAAETTAVASEGGLKWEKFSPDRVKQALADKKPVFIDFTAAWCLTCQANELVVFRSEDVQKKLKDLNMVLLRADWTSHDPLITQTLAGFGRSGVPLYVLYDPAKGEEPYLFPELINATIVLNRLNEIKSKR